MYRHHPVTIGLIFMNPENYNIFLDTLKSILKNRFFNIHLALVDNTGEKFFAQIPNPASGDPIDGLITKATGFSLLRQFKDYIHIGPGGDAVQLISNEQVRSVSENWNEIFTRTHSPVIIYVNDDVIVNKHFDRIIYDTVMGYDPHVNADVCSFQEVPPTPEMYSMEWDTITSISPGLHEGFNGCCWGATKDVLREVGRRQRTGLPFDSSYKLACYEDLDFYKMAKDGNPSFDFVLNGKSFVFHHGAKTRNSEMVQKLQDDFTNGIYHIDYNREVFKKKHSYSQEELEVFEQDLYKGWGDPERAHAVMKFYEKHFGAKNEDSNSE